MDPNPQSPGYRVKHIHRPSHVRYINIHGIMANEIGHTNGPKRYGPEHVRIAHARQQPGKNKAVHTFFFNNRWHKKFLIIWF